MYKQSFSPKKILYLTYHPEIGGGETILLSLISKLDKKKFEPIVITSKEGQLSKKLRALKIKTYILPLRGYLIRTLFIPGASPIGIYRFYKLCKKIKPDLIHINHLNLVIYAGISAKIQKIPVVATAHGSWDSIYFFQEILNSIFVDRIMAITQKVKNALVRRKILRSGKVNVITPGIDTEFFKPGDKNLARKKLKLPSDKIIITLVGRIDPVKDHITFLKSAEIITKRFNNIVFFIVGSKIGDFTGKKNSYLKQIRNFINTHPNLRRKIIFGGFIEDMPTVYQASDIVVSSSTSESFGLTLAEAASCQIPVVATNSEGQNLIVKENVNGYLVPPKNPDALAQQISKLITNKALMQRFGRNGRLHIIKNFSLEKYTKKVQEFYLYSMHKEKWPKT